MRAFFAAISDTGGGSASSATTAATAAAGAGPNVYARAVARGESLLSTEDHSSAGGEGVVSAAFKEVNFSVMDHFA